MKFSIWPMYSRPWDEVLAFAQHGEAAGCWHGLWYADHYMGNTGDETVSDEGGFECWAALSALSAVTSKLRLGTLVSPTTIHHPAILANRAATIDQISGGRFILGIGAGWQINEHKAYGIDLLNAGERVSRFEEAIQIVKMLLSEKRTNFSGKHFVFADAPCEPKPVQSPLPILVGTGGPRMSRIAARHADEWNVWGTPQTVAEKSAAMNEACEAVGRDPHSIRRSTQAMVFFSDNEEKSVKIREKSPEDRTIVGSSEYLVDTIAQYKEFGIDEFILPDFTLGRTAQERLDSYDRFATEVLPHLV